MKYFLELITNKPKNDVNQIIKSIDYKSISKIHNSKNAVSRFFVKILDLCRILLRMRKGDILLLQYPLKKTYATSCIFAHARGSKVITLIHDLGTFRRHKLTAAQEIKRLAHSDYIIVHNQSMNNWLTQHGCKQPLYNLQIFDYLSPSQTAQYNTPHKPWIVVFAGGLSKRRSGFLYDLNKHITNWQLNIYGKGFEDEFAKNWTTIKYKGSLPPDELVANVQADFGLVWDGDSMDECCGDWGEYLKINNPHKTSFYLRCGLPIIIWDKAAMANFITENKIGFCINSLKDIDETLANISAEQYAEMRKNAAKIGEQLANGHYTKTAIANAEMFLSKENN